MKKSTIILIKILILVAALVFAYLNRFFIDTFQYPTAFAHIYYIVWSLVALYVGTFAYFFTNKFIEGNSRKFLSMYEKTGLWIFKRQSEEMKADYMYLLTPVIGCLFLIIGFSILIQNI